MPHRSSRVDACCLDPLSGHQFLLSPSCPADSLLSDLDLLPQALVFSHGALDSEDGPGPFLRIPQWQDARLEPSTRELQEQGQKLQLNGQSGKGLGSGGSLPPVTEKPQAPSQFGRGGIRRLTDVLRTRLPCWTGLCSPAGGPRQLQTRPAQGVDDDVFTAVPAHSEAGSDWPSWRHVLSHEPISVVRGAPRGPGSGLGTSAPWSRGRGRPGWNPRNVWGSDRLKRMEGVISGEGYKRISRRPHNRCPLPLGVLEGTAGGKSFKTWIYKRDDKSTNLTLRSHGPEPSPGVGLSPPWGPESDGSSRPVPGQGPAAPCPRVPSSQNRCWWDCPPHSGETPLRPAVRSGLRIPTGQSCTNTSCPSIWLIRPEVTPWMGHGISGHIRLSQGKSNSFCPDEDEAEMSFLSSRAMWTATPLVSPVTGEQAVSYWPGIVQIRWLGDDSLESLSLKELKKY